MSVRLKIETSSEGLVATISQRDDTGKGIGGKHCSAVMTVAKLVPFLSPLGNALTRTAAASTRQATQSLGCPRQRRSEVTRANLDLRGRPTSVSCLERSWMRRSAISRASFLHGRLPFGIGSP